MIARRGLLAASILAASAGAPIAAAAAVAALAMPRGPVVLTVGGAIERTNDGPLARFDLAMLDAIDRTAFATATPWHDHRARFEGVSGRALMRAVGGRGTSVAAIALNDYTSTIPMSDFSDLDLLIASRVDGRQLSVRERGPLWIVYPFDSRRQLNSGVYHGRSVWQLTRLEIR